MRWASERVRELVQLHKDGWTEAELAAYFEVPEAEVRDKIQWAWLYV